MNNKVILTLLLLSAALVNGLQARSDALQEISLDGTWTVKGFYPGMGMWKPTFRILLVQPPPDPRQLTEGSKPCQVPGTVQKALLKAGLIPDPYVEEQAREALWVEDNEWWFVRYFDVPADWAVRLVTLECNMINYRADVWINQVWCGVSEGNYLRLKMEVEKALKFGQKNIITIRVRSIPNSTAAIPDPWFTRGRYDSTLMRRPWVTSTHPQKSEYLVSSCLFGWDWGPHLVPIGILQPIKLVAREKLQLDKPFIVTRTLTPDKDALMDFSVTVTNQGIEKQGVSVNLNIYKKGSTQVIQTQSFPVEVLPLKSQIVSESFILKRPELWWPLPLGKHPLYQMEVTLIREDGVQLDRMIETFGVRTLEKVSNEDPQWLAGVKIPETETADGIYNWTFVINGEKVFAQGVNWIPVDAMLDLHPERYRYLLRLAANAHVNMLRVWGEGLYETDTFYDLCDSLGIMVWQDFWVGSYSPAQSQDKSWEAVKTNVLRTRNHTSLVLYCGGNEYDASRPDRMAQIDRLIELCQTHDGTREFHKASPHGGDEHGGMGILPKEERRFRYWRFISEGGYTQSWPPRSDMLKFMKEEELFPVEGNEDRLAFRNVELIRDPHRHDAVYGVPDNLDELIHIQMLHNVIGWQSELENTRLEKFKVSGCLFWAHNDVWPTTSWSMIDYFGTAKNHYYAFKKAGRPLQVTASQQYPVLKPGEPYELEICVINDFLTPYENVRVKVAIYFGEKGKIVYQKQLTGSVSANRTICIGTIDWKVPDDPAEHNFLLRLELFDSKNHLITTNDYTCMIGDRARQSVSGGFFGEYQRWTKNEILVQLTDFPTHLKPGEEKQFTITYLNSTSNIIMGLETLITDLPEGIRFYLDDNYIHLVPGEKRTIQASIEFTERADISGPITLSFQIDGWNVKRNIKKYQLNLSQF
jgi:beta-mannosidase